ncbi:MAG: class IV adenylate cyclase [Bryobacteraceae bacterium]
MSRSESNYETEIKLRVSDAESARALLLQSGYAISVPRVLEVNVIFDTPDLTLRRGGLLLRLRRTASLFTMTVKGPVSAGKHKSRPEYEVMVSDFGSAEGLLLQLGYQEVFRYEKYRTEFTSTLESGTITLDETPIGVFLELEGPGSWIDGTADRLGFSPSLYIIESYGKLYSEYSGVNLGAPRDMLFGT